MSLTIIAILTFVLIVGSIQSPVSATEPSAVVLTYDPGSQTLAVNVSHDVANIKTHYIENIEISNNGISTLNRSYANQSYDWGMYDTFTVSTSVGDNLTVIATCKRGHSLTQWLIATSTTSTSSTSTETTTQTTNGTYPLGTSMDVGPAIVVSFTVIIALIIFFAWLNPDRVPNVFKQLGARIKSGFSNLVQQIRTRSSSK